MQLLLVCFLRDTESIEQHKHMHIIQMNVALSETRSTVGEATRHRNRQLQVRATATARGLCAGFRHLLFPGCVLALVAAWRRSFRSCNYTW
jgi:hypothetical protein